MKPNPNYRSVPPNDILYTDEDGVEHITDSANAPRYEAQHNERGIFTGWLRVEKTGQSDPQVEGRRIGKSQTPPELFWFGDHGKFRGFLRTDLPEV